MITMVIRRSVGLGREPWKKVWDEKPESGELMKLR